MRPHQRITIVLAILGLSALTGLGCERRAPGAATATETREARVLYHCAMHPQIVSDRPGVCPICQMRLERVDAPTLERVDAPTAEPGGVPGHAGFTLAPDRQQLIGVRRGRVERRSLTRTIRAVATVAADAELYRALVEYREAVRTRGTFGAGRLDDGRTGAASLVDAAALKLRRQGLAPDQIRKLATTGDPTELLVAGEQVWVYARVFAADANLIRPGQAVTLTSTATPGVTYRAAVAVVDGTVDPATRTVRVRIPVATPGGTLRPETFVQAVFTVPLGEAVAVPIDAVLDTGAQQFVFVVSGEGVFQPRAVQLGRRADDWVAIDGGVAEGEEVVTSANFLIDSESRVRAALDAFGNGAPRATPTSVPAP